MLQGLSSRNHRGSSRLRSQAIAALCVLALAIPGSAGAKNYNYSETEINQKDAGGYASNNYWNGSGDSKDEGVRNGMRALNRLASLDIGGAIHYGYKGYGNYINSQKMDDLDARTWKLKGTMDSAGGAPILSGISGGGGGQSQENFSSIGPEQESAHLPTGSNTRRGKDGPSSITKKFSEMDRGFLYRGETGEVAAEFERRSGMKREEFFDHLASAADSGLSWDDPNLADKFEQRYQAFVARIPNKEFKSNIEKMHSLFSLAKKTALLEEMGAFYKKNRWGDGSAQQVANNSDVNNQGSNVTAASSGLGSTMAGDDGRGPASVEGMAAVAAAKTKTDEKPKLTKEQMGMYLGLEGTHGDELKDFIGDGETIFRLVSKRYRKLTPMMIGKITSVLDSK